eukprot:TRINITY_DN10512_c0_g1_i3.p1 TRINITY_DN10512_c0_g1~~TRINITY_DN10512_c0_g1_i3.p1  ORF type:complete len:249 (-),score=31.88 TRINITY_DN10512_c0_g1_i3:202-915(-)
MGVYDCVIFVFSLLLLLLGIIINEAAAKDTPEYISQCVTISLPGHYMLVQHITVADASIPCILVSKTRDVILDGNGHFMTYTHEPDYERQITGISIIDVINITVTDIMVDSFDTGIYAMNVQDLIITFSTIKGTNSYCVEDCSGIAIEGATNVTIMDTLISNFGNSDWTPNLNQSCLGMYFSHVTALTVQSCTIQNIKGRRGPLADGPIANIGGIAGGIAVVSTSFGIFQTSPLGTS